MSRMKSRRGPFRKQVRIDLKKVPIDKISSMKDISRVEVENVELFDLFLVARPSLTYLSLKKVAEPVDLSPLSDCKNLTALGISAQEHDIDLSPLGGLPNLYSLGINHYGGEVLDLTPLRSCPNLTSFSIYHSELKDLDLKPLGESGTIKELEILFSKELRDIDLSSLKSCKNLETIKIVGCSLQDIDMLWPLFDIPSLKKIDLSCNNFHSHILLLDGIDRLNNLEVFEIHADDRTISTDEQFIGAIIITDLLKCGKLKQFECDDGTLLYADERFKDKRLPPAFNPFDLDEDDRDYEDKKYTSSSYLERINWGVPKSIE